MAGEKTATYTAEQTVQVLELYSKGVSAKEISELTGKSERSVIAKLAREGVYKAKEPTQPKRKKKAELVASIASMLGLDIPNIESLEKATHEALELVEASIAQCVKPDY